MTAKYSQGIKIGLLFVLTLGLLSGLSAGASSSDQIQYFPLNDTALPATDFSPLGIDASGYDDGDLETGATGKFDQAFRLDASGSDSDAVNINISRKRSGFNWSTSSWTVSGWMNPDTIQGNPFIFHTWGTGTDVSLQHNQDGSGNIWYLIDNNEQGNFYDTGVEAGAGTWTHFALVHDPTNDEVRMFVNGSLTGTAPVGSEIAIDRSGDCTDSYGNCLNGFGSRSYPNRNNKAFDGRLDNLLIYDTVLTDSEINTLYNNQTLGSSSSGDSNNPPGLTNPDPSDTETAVSIDTDLEIQADDADGDSLNVTFLWQNGTQIHENTGVSAGTVTSTSNLSLSYDTTYNWQVKAVDGNGGTSYAGNYSFTTEVDSSSSGSVNPANMVLRATLNDSTAVDVGGVEEDPVNKYNSPSTGQPGIFDQSWNLDDTNPDSVNFDLSGKVDFTGSEDFSIKGHFNPDVQEGNPFLAHTYGQSILTVQYNQNGNGGIWFLVDDTFRDSGVDVPTGEWSSFALTWDASQGEAKGYVNGELTNTITSEPTPFSSKSETSGFGARGYSNRNDKGLNGNLDELQIYNVTLTDTEVSNLDTQETITGETDSGDGSTGLTDGSLSSSTIQPSSPFSVDKNNLFDFEVNVTCSNGTCGKVDSFGYFETSVGSLSDLSNVGNKFDSTSMDRAHDVQSRKRSDGQVWTCVPSKNTGIAIVNNTDVSNPVVMDYISRPDGQGCIPVEDRDGWWFTASNDGIELMDATGGSINIVSTADASGWDRLNGLEQNGSLVFAPDKDGQMRFVNYSESSNSVSVIGSKDVTSGTAHGLAHWKTGGYAISVHTVNEPDADYCMIDYWDESSNSYHSFPYSQNCYNIADFDQSNRGEVDESTGILYETYNPDTGAGFASEWLQNNTKIDQTQYGGNVGMAKYPEDDPDYLFGADTDSSQIDIVEINKGEFSLVKEVSVSPPAHHDMDTFSKNGNDYLTVPVEDASSSGENGLQNYKILKEGGEVVDLKACPSSDPLCVDDGGQPQTSSNLTNSSYQPLWSINGTEPGNYTIFSESTSNRSGVSNSSSPTVDVEVTSTTSVDTTPPSSSDNWTATGFVDMSSALVELTATDSESSVSNITYWLNGVESTIQGASGTVSITSEGDNSLVYRATDSAGNVESNNTESVKLDATSPSISFTDSTTSDGTYSNQDWIFVNVSCTDNIGVVSCTENFDGSTGEFVTSSGEYYWTNHTELADGTYSIDASVSDQAGNSDSTGSKSVTIDTPNLTTADFVVDSDSDWSQGSFTRMRRINGELQLALTGTDGNKEPIVQASNLNDRVSMYDLRKNVFRNFSSEFVGSVTGISGVADLDPAVEGKQVYFRTGSTPYNLEYYNMSSQDRLDTGVDVDSLGGSADMDNDNYDEIFLVTSSGEFGWYDYSDKTVTTASTGKDNVLNVGRPEDFDADSDVEVPVQHEGSSGEASIGIFDFGTNSFTEWFVIGPDSANTVGGFGDLNNDGGEDLVYGEVSNYPLGTIYYGDSNGDTFTLDNEIPYLVGDLADIDGNGDQELLIENSDGIYYDTGLSSQTSFSDVSSSSKVAADVDYASSGNYISKTFSTGKKKEWSSIKLDLSRLDGATTSLTVESSSDDFSTVNQSQSFTDTDLQAGKNTYQLDQLTEPTKYIRFKVDMNRGGTGVVDRVNLTGEPLNSPPTVNQQRLSWKGIGGTESTKIEYSLSDPENNLADIVNSVPSGSITEFTNTSAVVDSPGNTFDYLAEFEDSLGASDLINTNYTLDNVFSGYVENSTGVVNTTQQMVNLTAEVDVRGDGMVYDVFAEPPSINLETVFNGSESSTTSFTGVKQFKWYFKTDHIETVDYSTETNRDKNSTFTTQYLQRNKQVVNNWSTDFSRVTVEPLTPEIGSNTCSTQDYSVPGNSEINVSCNSTGDFINNQSYGFNVEEGSIVLGFDYDGAFTVEVDNTVNYGFNGISTSGSYGSVDSCSQVNNSEVDVAANEFKNYSIGHLCDPGSVGNPSQEVNNITGGDRVWINSTDMVINTNETENNSIVIRTDKSQWQFGSVYDGGSLEAYVEGVNSVNNSELNISDTGSFFRITVGKNFQNSSLHTDDTDWAVTYTNTDTIDDDTGGGGGGTDPDSDSQVVYFGSDETSDGIETVNVPLGETVVRNMSVTNERQSPVTVQVSTGSSGVCSYVSVQRTQGSEQFSDSGSYDVAAATQTLGTVETTEEFRIRYSLPNRTVLNEQGISDLSCEFETSSSYGVAEPLVVQVEEDFTLTGFLSDLPIIGDWLLDDLFCYPTGDVDSLDASGDQCVKNWQATLFALVGLVLVVVGRRNGWF